ncbi:MAG: hypothetical protein FJ286_15850 [Planctomycetes bacterium]|nr:hypothetical protein [Planctomycetota bacterium]
MKLYQSVNATFDPTDQMLDSQTITPAPNTSATASFARPTQLAPDSRYLLVVADPLNTISEANENNNMQVVAATSINITSLSERTFVSTDEIELRATVRGAQPGTRVLWTVEGKDAAANVAGFPTDFVTTTDDAGVATFRFTPSNNPNLVSDRHTRWTRGSYAANRPLAFDVTAKVTIDGTELTAGLSRTSLGPLSQDETDRLRQEYYDYRIPVPERADVISSLGGGYNRGNYRVQLSDGLDTRYKAILTAYRGQAVTVTVNGRQYDTTIPADASITITSGYRCPQRNKAAGSLYPNSLHTRGRALDLAPNPVSVTINVNGRPTRVVLPLHQTLYPALYAAARRQGRALAEAGNDPVPVGDTRENHIHVQW